MRTRAARIGHRAVDEPGFGPGVRRDVVICSGERVCAIASTLIPRGVVRSHPWLDSLGNRALGESLKARLDVERGPYEFRELSGERGTTPGFAWARRYRFDLFQGALVVTELFPADLLAELGATLAGPLRATSAT